MDRSVIMLVLALFASVAIVPPSVAAAPHQSATATAVPCESLSSLTLPSVTSIAATSVPAGSFDPPGPTEPIADLPTFCRVALTVTPAINIEVWLPTNTWNNRFQAVGGGGYAGVISYPALGTALKAGYATVSTDTGHTGTSREGSWALGPDGKLNQQLITDFAYRSLHEMTIKAKAFIQAFYGTAPQYSYWNGCSTGGRQGLMEAQRFPDDYDGILAGAPAINWDRFIPAELWPQVVMQQELGAPIPAGTFDRLNTVVVAEYDGLDGVTDGVINDPRRVEINLSVLKKAGLTDKEIAVVKKIWEGARGTKGEFLWYGLEPGAPLRGLAGPEPFPTTLHHHRYWVEQNPAWDWKTLDYAGFEENFRRSQQLFHEVIGTDNPNLSAFKASGGKVLIWHGWNDELIFPRGTIDYY